MIMPRFLMFSVAFSAIFPTVLALANDRSPGLPGVQLPKPIISAPPPAPEPDQPPVETWKNFRIGNTDVSVSGDITIDVGTGNSRISGR
ncbi:hypothetical protein FHS76_001727 [Ochrobactrum daejeonense]|uniref:Uncharacterized protein n=1 Tax=Brucella daejeonensis TaxID=659015 RepID=A0A7W9EMA1_9HYPH|nr:hypothetical protein [Brucella daejeonensis]MBB5701865.1 hypothetical protein [Brucella daejeonensis]